MFQGLDEVELCMNMGGESRGVWMLLALVGVASSEVDWHSSDEHFAGGRHSTNEDAKIQGRLEWYNSIYILARFPGNFP